jgi:hypothetical protein
VKTYELRATSHPDLCRVVDCDGDWQFYFHRPTERYLRGITTVLNAGFEKGPGFHEAEKRATPEEWNRKLLAGSDRGDAIHQAISTILSGEPFGRYSNVLAADNVTNRCLRNDEWDAVLSFERFWTSHDCVVVAHEESACNLQLGIAGTLDVILRMRKACGDRYCKCAKFVDKLGLLDWKSGRGVYESFGAQVAALAHSDLVRLIGSHSIRWTGIVRVGTTHKRGFELAPYGLAETTLNFKRFRAALTIAEAHMPPFDAKHIREIPEELSLTIERENLIDTEAQERVA